MNRRCGWILCCAVLTLAATKATAQPAAPTVTGNADLARDWANKAKERFQTGDYTGVIDAIREAEKHFRAPTFTRLSAQAHQKLGKLLEAQALYRSLTEMKLATDAPPAWVTAQEEAKKELTAITARIPGLAIVVRGADPAWLKVTLDGSPLEPGRLGEIVPQNPGSHTIVVESAGRNKVTRRVQLEEGAVKQLVIELAAVDTVPAGPGAPTAPGSAAALSPGGERSFVGPAIAFGAGGAGLLLGTIMGGLAITKTADLRALCGADLRCPPGDRGKADVDGATAMAHASTAGFVLAGVGAAVGVFLLVFPGTKTIELAQARVVLGPGFAGVKGTF